jgi:hypothetical protein
MSRGISNEQPPESTAEKLREFLARRFSDIAIALSQDPDFTPRKTMPYNPQIGAIHYFPDPSVHNFDPEILWEGFWGLTNNGWVYIGSDHSTLAQYGGIRLVTPEPFVLDTTWRDIPFDSGIITNPVGVVQDPATNALYVQSNGVWRVSVVVTFHQDPLINTARNFDLRIYNETRDIASPTLLFPTGRNVDTTEANAASIFELLFSTGPEKMVVQIRTDDIYTNVEMIEANFSINQVSEYYP